MEKKRDSLLPNPLEEFSRAFEAVDRRGRQVFRRMRVPFRLSRVRVKGGDEIMDFIYLYFQFANLIYDEKSMKARCSSQGMLANSKLPLS